MIGGMNTRTASFILGLSIALAAPLAVSAFGLGGDQQCTNPQYDYTCQKGSRCPSRKQGGKGTECVDPGSGVPGMCMGYYDCKATKTADGKDLHQFKPGDLQDWGGLGEGASPFGMGDTPFNAGELTQLSSPQMTDGLSGAFGDSAGLSDTPADDSGSNAFGSSDFAQQDGAAAPPSTPGFGQDATGHPFGDVPAPTETPTADAANGNQGLGDQASLSPQGRGNGQGGQQSGGQSSGGSGGGQGGAPQMPQMGGGGGGSKSGGQGQGGQQPTGFDQQQQLASQQALQQAQLQNQNWFQKLWDWLTGKTDSSATQTTTTTN